MRVPVALNEATARSPRSSASLLHDGSVTSAVTGPIFDADTIADVNDRADVVLDHVHHRVGCLGAPDRDLPRVDDDSDLPTALVRRVDAVSASEIDHGEAVLAGCATPRMTLAPVNDATKTSAGFATRLCGGPY